MRSRTPVFSRITRSLTVRLSLATALVLVSVLSLVHPAHAVQKTDTPFVTAQFAPEDSAFYFRVPLDTTSDQWRQVLGLAATVSGDPELADADLNDLAELSDEPFSLDIFFGGEVGIIGSDTAVNIFAEAVAESANDGTSLQDMELTESGLAFAITTPRPELLAIGLRAAISQTAREVGTRVERTSVDGVSVMSVSVPVGSGATPLAFARVGDVLLVSGFASDLTPVIETGLGTRPALSDSADFQRSLTTVDSERFAFGYLSSVWPESFRRAMVEIGVPPSALPPAGPAAAVALWAEADGIAIDALAFADASAATESTFPAVSAISGAPDDTMIYVAGHNLYGTGIFQVIAGVAFGTSGAPSTNSEDDLTRAFAPFSDSLGVNIVGDILARVNGDYAVWVQPTASDEAVNAVLTAGVDDPERVQGAIRQLSFLIQSFFEGDDNVTSLPIGDRGYVFQLNTGEQAVDPLSYGVVGDELIVGMGTGPAQLSEAAGALTENPLYAATIGDLPPASIAAMYVNLDLALPLITETTGGPIPGLPEADDSDSDVGDRSERGLEDQQFDADPACEGFADQTAAQAAYDEFAPGSFALDRNFDGRACEDFFGSEGEGVVAIATPQAEVEPDSTTASGPISAVGFSVYEDSGLVRIGGRILIAPSTDTEP